MWPFPTLPRLRAEANCFLATEGRRRHSEVTLCDTHRGADAARDQNCDLHAITKGLLKVLGQFVIESSLEAAALNKVLSRRTTGGVCADSGH